ncbi:MAG: mucoidy inhibitor MuiA family protein [Chloroflexi bacterium]|nr:mucoidy inhibitor MuiA family protein [Chloroflexota bacterium]
MTNLEAPIVSVTVYTNKARVTRQGNAHLTPGEHTLAIANIPRSLDTDSVRASGKGTGVRIMGVDVSTRYVKETPDADAMALEQQLDTLREQDKILADEDATRAGQVQLLKTLRQHSGERFAKAFATGTANIEALRPVTQYLAEELSMAKAQRRDIAKRRRELSKEIQAVEARLSQAQSTTATEWREIQVTVEATAETELQLEVTYAVPAASWEPLYDMRLVNDTVTVMYLAQVRQASGEDWPAVQLALSTARPAKSMTIPKLTPWYVDRYKPPQPIAAPAPAMTLRAAKPASIMQPAPIEPASRYDTGALPDVAMIEAEVESNGAAVTYHTARPVAVPSDGSPHKTTVTTLALGAKLDYVIAPKLALEAYLRAKIQNDSTVLLLPGKAQIFHGDEYVGSMQITRVVAPGETFEAQLGVEDRIKVERELMERATSKTVFGNTRRIVIGYKVKLTNNLPTPAHVLVMDQMPVSLHEDIKIRLHETPVKPTEQTDLNVLKWELDLPPGTTYELPFSFAIEHPREMSLTGLGQTGVA